MKVRFTSGGSGTLLLSVLVLVYWLPLAVWIFAFTAGRQDSAPLYQIFWPVVVTSFQVAAISTLLSFGAAFIFIWLWLLSARLRDGILALMIVPLVVGFLARNYAWIGILSQWQPTRIALLYNWQGVILVMSTVFVPTAFFVLLHGLASIEGEVIEAARTLGVSDSRMFWRLLVPLTLRSQVLALLLTFSMAVGYFITPRMIGGGKMSFVSTAILTYFKAGNVKMASIIATYFLLVVSVPSILLCVVAVRRREKQAGF